MNITPLDIYLVSLADDLVKALGLVFVCSVATIVVSGFSFIMAQDCSDRDDWQPLFRKAIRNAFITLLVSFSLIVVIPDSKTLAAMYIIPRLANSEIVSKDIPEAGKALIEMATEWMRTQTKSIKEAAK